MRIAETAGMTALVACALLGTAASFAAASWRTANEHRFAAPTTSVHSPRIGRCGVSRHSQHPALGSDYREVLVRARGTLEACIDGAAGTEVRLRFEITEAGRVRKLDVMGANAAHTRCLRTVSNGLVFPVNAHPVMISTVLRKD